jgi:L-glyceraldehyde 3-phosphate reductase
MALAWVLRSHACTSALIGTSTVEQVDQDVATIANLSFSDAELQKIEAILA